MLLRGKRRLKGTEPCIDDSRHRRVSQSPFPVLAPLVMALVQRRKPKIQRTEARIAIHALDRVHEAHRLSPCSEAGRVGEEGSLGWDEHNNRTSPSPQLEKAGTNNFADQRYGKRRMNFRPCKCGTDPSCADSQTTP